MIRYEIFSNVASSEVGLQEYPVLTDLADTLALKSIETRFVKQVLRQQEEINVASGQFAKGLTVRGTTVRVVQPQTSLKGCLAWLKSVSARVDRGLHMEIGKVRATMGTALILGQLQANGQKAFLTGTDNGNWERLVARTDPELKQVPPEIARSPDVLRDYLARVGRPVGFLDTLRKIVEFEFLAPEFRKLLTEILRTRNEGELKKLSEAQVVNVGLISDTWERYQKLLEDFFADLEKGEFGGDLAPIFSMLTQGIPLEGLRAKLLPFTLDLRRKAITDKRALVNEVRIGLAKAEESAREEFRRVLSSLVLETRLARDPLLYRKTVRLDAADAEEIETLAPNRRLFIALRGAAAKLAAVAAEPATPLPLPVKQGIYEMVVGLLFQGKFTVRHRGEVLPRGPNLARQILSCFPPRFFNIDKLKGLNPKLPVRGVAQNLANRVPLTVGDLAQLVEILDLTLFPLAEVADELSGVILSRYKDQEAQQRTAAVATYLEGAFPLLPNSNYILGRAGQSPLMWQCALSAGRALGLTVLSSRDQIKNREALEQLAADPTVEIEGYVSLMGKEENRFFPLRSQPELLGRAYRFLFHRRVVALVRRLCAHRLNSLFERHGAELFELFYQHLIWGQQLQLSRYQLGMILYREKVFDSHRLKDFGFRAGAMENGQERDNPWLHARDDAHAEDPKSHPFSEQTVERETRAALGRLNALQTKARERAEALGEGKRVSTVFSEMAEEETFDLQDEAFRQHLGKTEEANVLWREIQEIVSKHFKTIIPEDAGEEAIEFTLAGPLAHLSWLGDSRPFQVSGKSLLFHLKPAWDAAPDELDAGSRVVTAGLREMLAGAGKTGPKQGVREAVEFLQAYRKAWVLAKNVLVVPLIDQMLRETLLTLVRPSPPAPSDIIDFPEDQVLCLAMSSSDQGRFTRIVAHPDRGEVFATLSQVTSWLAGFQRLREELEYQRDIIADVLDIIARLNLSVYDAPYIPRYRDQLKKLDETLIIRPEDISLDDLARIETTALETGRLAEEIQDQERSFAFKDRWLNRVLMRLRRRRSNAQLNFADRLYERATADSNPEESGEARGAQNPSRPSEQYQTFSERVRNVIDHRSQLLQKEVVVLSPGPTQKWLTLELIDDLFRLKGLHFPILADVSGGANFLDELRTRLPPHRLFDLTRM